MTYTTPGMRKCLTAACFGAAIAIPSTPQAALNDIVIIKGESSDTPIGLAQGFSSNGEIDIEKACRATNRLIGEMAFGLAATGMSSYVFGFEPTLGDIPQADCSKAEKTEGRYTIMFASCSMLMTDGVHTIRWIVPPDAPEAQMIIADAQTGQIIKDGNVMLETSLSQISKDMKGRATSQTVKPASGSNTYDIQLEIGPTGNYRTSTETYTGRAYSFEYTGKLDIPGMEAAGMSFGSMESKGTAWISPDAPGSDVVAKFYENFKTHVVPATENGTLFTAMIEQMADVVAYGMPLETEQTVTTGIAAGLGRMGAGNMSTSKVKSITVWQGAASEHQVCGQIQTPEGFEEISMQQMMSGTNESSQDAQQMNEAMQQYNEAMQNLTPEQKQMMEQMGAGNMLEQIMGGAVPGAQQPDPSAAAPAASESSGSNMPLSSELQSGNLTESVQRHLQALGYDVGETNGEMSMETTIAISTFQAEKGLEVTGEVSPQLLGMLSAEVDRQR